MGAADSLSRLAILASGNGSNMQAIADACSDGTIPARITVIGSNRPGAGVLERARRAGIPQVVVDHRDYATRDAFDRAMLAELEPHAPDLVVLAGFMRILTPLFIASFRGRLLNIHPSLLPKYPGLKTHARALAAGDREHGATVHFVTDELDGGPPVLQARVPIIPDDNADTLAARVLELEHRIYPQAISWWVKGRLRLTAGEVTLDGKTMPATGIPYTPGKT
ncbi:phosphoribosylglycinamide formyltransferase [Chromatocurvus halotolerans]|uniref:Phosphoribosylglycinamide formyltransferase n=1 Tax=Chromatocurvus halotolerans TaxID=1132028 RepID=A0A4R2KP54_9GAMM|nr:phosphoribosylglycinamide formyltransferase [Chromatocurvus halotolerans]TCO75961.1 phosphoribosylglycinamide formyltransferase-1 [Chromatocurvus halotolerans]